MLWLVQPCNGSPLILPKSFLIGADAMEGINVCGILRVAMKYEVLSREAYMSQVSVLGRSRTEVKVEQKTLADDL